MVFIRRGGVRANFDQQPIEAQATVSACLEAYRSTSDFWWYEQAQRAFDWFIGWNDLGLELYHPESGGCGDGLHVDRVNGNQGAESTLAFLLSLAEMQPGSKHGDKFQRTGSDLCVNSHEGGVDSRSDAPARFSSRISPVYSCGHSVLEIHSGLAGSLPGSCYFQKSASVLSWMKSLPSSATVISRYTDCFWSVLSKYARCCSRTRSFPNKEAS